MIRETFAAGLSRDEEGNYQVIVQCVTKAYVYDDPAVAVAAMDDMVASPQWNAAERECLGMVRDLVERAAQSFPRLAETHH